MSDWKKIFSNRDFVYLFISQLVSQITIQLLNFLFILKIYSETGSSIATSIVWIFYALPSLIFGPFAATIVDLFDRRKLLIYTNLFQSILVLLLSFFYTRSIFTIYIVIFLYSSLNQLYVPSESVSLTEIIKKKDLSVANGIFFTSSQLSIIVGFLIAGILNKFLGFNITLYISSALLFIGFVAVTFLPKSNFTKKVSSIENVLIDFIQKIFEGYKYISESRQLMYAYVLQVILNSSLTIVVVNIPAIAKSILKMNSDMGSILIVLPTVAGSVFASYYVPSILKKTKRKIKLIYKCLIALCVVTFLLAIIFSEIPNTNLRLTLQLASFSILGFSFVGIVIPLTTLIQEISPANLRGRVLGNLWFLTTLINIFPILFSGIISEIFGIRIMVFILFAIFLSLLVFIKTHQKKLYVEL